MPEKSVREMSELERKHYSLAARTFHAAIMGAVVIGLAAFIVGIGLFAYALIGQDIGECFGLSRSTAVAVEEVADVDTLARDVMAIYHSLSDEERAGTRTEAYRAHYADIMKREDYQTVHGILKDFLKASDVNDVFVAVYDEKTSAIVYLIDPDERPGHICQPGDWETIGKRELNRFLNWDGKGQLHYISKRVNFAWLCTAGVPVGEGKDGIHCFVLADLSLVEVIHGMNRFALLYTIVLSVVTLIVAYFMTQHMKKTLVLPINEIAQAAEAYVVDKRNGEMNTDHFTKLNIRTGDEVENLSLVMADMEHDLTAYEENLTQVTAEKERVSTELSMATQIQESMLPNIFPAFPTKREFDIYASMNPAREVGGDFYDFFLIDEDHLCMVMADVSGKGIPAALFMMATKIIIQSCAMLGRGAGEILDKTNEAVCSNNEMEMFVTCWVGVLDLRTGLLTAANAGHEYPALCRRNGQFQLYHDKHGLVIGAFPGVKYKEYQIQLHPGDRLFLYTDGVPEATDANDKMFGTERMLETLNTVSQEKPEDILHAVREAVDAFVKDAPQFDDLTMLSVVYKGKEE